MGPIALFDKSFLQSLSTDESVWFDHFFLAVVCPIFYVETLADLAKGPTKGRPAEAIVRDIANKFPEMGGSPCIYHHDMCIQDLLGNHVPLDSRVPRPGGRAVRSGTIYDQSHEEIAFQRWQRGRFQEVERLAAADWRAELAALDLDKFAKELRGLGIDGKTCKSLEQARDLARAVVSGRDKLHSRLALAVQLFHIPQHLHPRIIAAWTAAGQQTLEKFAPYAAHVLTIEVFFQFALAAGLIATERASNRTDIAYLFYLPFCTLFVSSDNLHRRCAPLFMRPNQEFVWGVDLKAGLKQVNAHFLTLPEDERDKGIMKFGGRPPAGSSVSEVWDRHMRPKMRTDKEDRPPDPVWDAEIVKRMKEFRKQPTLDPHDPSTERTDDMLTIKRRISRKRGSWWQVPKDLPDDADEDDD